VLSFFQTEHPLPFCLIFINNIKNNNSDNNEGTSVSNSVSLLVKQNKTFFPLFLFTAQHRQSSNWTTKTDRN
jgi:hypothetical protein